MDNDTASRVPVIAARIMQAERRTVGDAPEWFFNELLDDAKILAASCLSQDEPTEAQREAARLSGMDDARRLAGNFHTRLKDEREDLDRRLTALNSYLTHNPGKPSPRHNAMLVEQARLMSELLAVIDERLCDIGITERSAPVPVIDEDDGA